MNQLDKELQGLTLTDWKRFADLFGSGVILKAQILVLRSQGMSYGKISNKLNIKYDHAKYVCKKHRKENFS